MLRDSPLRWHEKLSEVLAETGMSQCDMEPCLFASANKSAFALIYVDDVLCFESNETKLAEFEIALISTSSSREHEMC